MNRNTNNFNIIQNIVNNITMIDMNSTAFINELIERLEIEVQRFRQLNYTYRPIELMNMIIMYLKNRLEILELRNRIQLLETICISQ